MHNKARWAALLLASAALSWTTAGGQAHAQCVAGREYRQSEAVKARYPDPPVQFATPAFRPGKTDFTSHDEMMRFLRNLARTADNLIAVAMEPESPSSFVSWGLVPTDRRGLANPQSGAPSEVPVYRLLQPVAFETQPAAR